MAKRSFGKFRKGVGVALVLVAALAVLLEWASPPAPGRAGDCPDIHGLRLACDALPRSIQVAVLPWGG